jgi:hypothetical protein
MNNSSFRIPRAHLVMALCLTVAALLGYELVDPLQPGSLAVVMLALTVLSIPLLMKWHHPLLIASWNASIAPSFLPGQPPLWMLLSGVGLFFGILNRAVDPNRRFVDVPSIRNSLLCLGAVVIVTTYATGGIGFGIFGSSLYGGKRVFYVLAALMGYFALTSQPIPTDKAEKLVAFFFLSQITLILPELAPHLGGAGKLIFHFFPENLTEEQPDFASPLKGIYQWANLSALALAVYCFVSSRHGLSGMFEPGKLWRTGILLLTFLAVAASGKRSVLIVFLLVFGAQFYFERLYQTRVLWVLTGLTLVAAGLIPTFSEKLPPTAQRALSFLPLRINPEVRKSADDSSNWRMQMWQSVLPELPRYVVKGRGFRIDPESMYFSTDPTKVNYDWAVVSGDFHSGPLTIFIPLGIWGVLTFSWFCWASLSYLYQQHLHAPPGLQSINTLLLSLFTAQLILFLLVYGSFYSDLFGFTGLIGLSVGLNGQRRSENPAVRHSELTQLRLRRLAEEFNHNLILLKTRTAPVINHNQFLMVADNSRHDMMDPVKSNNPAALA